MSKDKPFLSLTLTVTLCPQFCIFFVVSPAIQKCSWFLYSHLIVFYAQDNAQKSFFNLKLYSCTQLNHLSFILLSSFLCACVSGKCSSGGRPVCCQEVPQSLTLVFETRSLTDPGDCSFGYSGWASSPWNLPVAAHTSIGVAGWGEWAQLASTGNTFILYAQYYNSKFNLLRIK